MAKNSFVAEVTFNSDVSITSNLSLAFQSN